MRIKVFIILISCLSSIVSSVFFSILHNHFYRKSFAVIRMEKILATHIEKYGPDKITNEERNHKTSLFSARLEKAIHDIEKKENVILLVKGAVVTELPDFTGEVINKIDEAFKNER